MNDNKKAHWENVYTTKLPHEVSWTQAIPATSLDFIRNFGLPKNTAIIDIGGGDSNLVDFLLEDGYTDITVLDISEAALERAKIRLGTKALKVHWIASDITLFKPIRQYTIWHDRATFHFLTTTAQIQSYLAIVDTALDGYLAIGTFSEKGPLKCSGLAIKQYSEEELSNAFSKDFMKLKCIEENHTTPFGTIQHFTFCTFRKK